MDDDAFDDAFDECAEALEAASALYVAEGDAPATRTPCRVITDDVKIGATAIAHCLDRMPLRPPVELDVTAYVTPAGADFAGYVAEDDRVKIVLSGKKATAASLKASLVAAAAIDFTAVEEIEA